ncbi:MAG: hypothetical protein IT384_03795 [Deltaproteobacteria bacterium]|nr:hypothetical protein [Deltaproteobacteria bacterium]
MRTAGLWRLICICASGLCPISAYAQEGRAAPAVSSTANPDAGSTIIALGGTVWLAEGGGLPSIHFGIVHALARHFDLTAELETLGVASAAGAGLRLRAQPISGVLTLAWEGSLIGAYGINDGSWGNLLAYGAASGPSTTLALGPVELTTTVQGIALFGRWTGGETGASVLGLRPVLNLEAQLTPGFRPFLRGALLATTAGTMGTVSIGLVF